MHDPKVTVEVAKDNADWKITDEIGTEFRGL